MQHCLNGKYSKIVHKIIWYFSWYVSISLHQDHELSLAFHCFFHIRNENYIRFCYYRLWEDTITIEPYGFWLALHCVVLSFFFSCFIAWICSVMVFSMLRKPAHFRSCLFEIADFAGVGNSMKASRLKPIKSCTMPKKPGIFLKARWQHFQKSTIKKIGPALSGTLKSSHVRMSGRMRSIRCFLFRAFGWFLTATVLEQFADRARSDEFFGGASCCFWHSSSLFRFPFFWQTNVFAYKFIYLKFVFTCIARQLKPLKYIHTTYFVHAPRSMWLLPEALSMLYLPVKSILCIWNIWPSLPTQTFAHTASTVCKTTSTKCSNSMHTYIDKKSMYDIFTSFSCGEFNFRCSSSSSFAWNKTKQS